MLIFVLAPQTQAQKTSDPCAHYSSNKQQHLACLDREIAKLDRKREFIEHARQWLKRFGVDYQNAEFGVDIEVAKRKRIVFALIMSRCTISTSSDFDVDRFKKCLIKQEKIETKLGNDLMKPLPIP